MAPYRAVRPTQAAKRQCRIKARSMKMPKRKEFLALLAGTALLAACNSKAQPAGQVAATVDGKEVTLQEVNTELQGNNVPETADKQAVQRALLQQVIERKLFIAAAQAKNLDKSPEYLSQKTRQDEILLAQLYARQQASAVAMPTDADIAKFMTENHTAFADRQQLVLDQIRWPAQNNQQAAKALANVHDLDGVAKTLTGFGIKFERGKTSIDSAQVPPKLMDQIDKLPATEPFVVPAGTMLTANVIIERKAVAADPARSRAAAVAAWRQQKLGEMLTQQMGSLRSTAKITYQPGFAPTAKELAAMAAAKKAAGS
jgi:EpsD family peptidyl-prolyl cis-trans isomerase